MNKIAIPVILSVVIAIAGFFAFVPIEEASTVHSSIATNVDTQDRGLYFKFNGTGDGRTPDSLATLIAAKTGRTLTGNFVMTAEHNHVVPAGYVLECGLVSTGATVFGNNATDTDDGTSPSSSGTFTGTSGEGIEIQIDGATSTVSGICEVTIYLDSGTG